MKELTYSFTLFDFPEVEFEKLFQDSCGMAHSPEELQGFGQIVSVEISIRPAKYYLLTGSVYGSPIAIRFCMLTGLFAVKINPELLETIVKTQFTDEGEEPKLEHKLTFRADIRNIEHLKHEAISSNNSESKFTFTIDEPPDRGGTNTGLHPLGHFVIGAAACFFNQLVKVAMVWKLNFDSMEITAIAHVRRKPQEHQESNVREFTDFTYDVRLTGSEEIQTLEKLVVEGENRCYVHQTLKKAIPLTTNLFLNGTQVLSHTVGPNTP